MKVSKVKTVWHCKECGYKQMKWTGSCAMCHKWNTFEEEIEESTKGRRFAVQSEKPIKPLRIHEVSPGDFRRILTGMKDLDRLLGGGVAHGSLTLLGGDPGIGKSTLMLQISHALAKSGCTVLYICGEESIEQTAFRAQRLDLQGENLYLLSETMFSSIKNHVEKIQPDFLVIDSIQIVYKEEIPSAPGSVTQVRELATEFMHLSKRMGISTFLIGHVTKSGEIAGPRVLEHIVDTVLDFEGDHHHGFRLLRAVKNRFGPTDDIALFQMGLKGLTEVINPSLLFLEERVKGSAGSIIVPTMEGSRAFLIEIQSLVAHSSFPTSTRRSTGVDHNRLALLLAVLEKKVGYQLHQCDVFVSIAGGLKIFEPAADLGIILSLVSSFRSKALDPDIVIFGEVGLGGEIRSVSKAESRIKEALHLGFKRCILPKKNVSALPEDMKSKISLLGVEKVEEAIDVLFG